MTYWLPLLDFVGNRPVWSVKSLPVICKHCIVTMFCWTLSPGEFVVISHGVGVGVGSFICVDRMFCRICRMWPFAVAMDFGRCLRTAFDERPGHVV